MTLKQKNFLLGVGCQKGGTSWLHDYLDAREFCDFGFTKEYHTFSPIFETGEEGFAISTLKRLSQITGKYSKRKNSDAKTNHEIITDFLNDQDLTNTLQRAVFRQNPKLYIAYFKQLAEPDSIKLVGDITPSYATLPPAGFQFIRDLLISGGFAPKVVFIMRDPIERVYSAIRMKIRDAKSASDDRLDPHVEFQRRYRNRNSSVRTNYHATITALDEVFEKHEVFYCFYEELFSDACISDITDFLEVPFEKPDFDKRVNSSPRQNDLPDETIRQARQFYNEVYNFCADRFGEDRVRKLWPHY